MKHAYTIKDTTILKVENVSLKFGEKTVLRDINVEIKDVIREHHTTGQVIGFLAPSGRGKTQLFKILSGLNKPTTGTVMLHGNPVKSGDIGFVFQHYPLMPHRTIFGNLWVAVMANERLKTKQEKLDKIDFYLTKFKLADKKLNHPSELSGGQRQRIAIIQQLLCSENFLLLDEPFSGLDINMIREVSEVILEVANMDELNTIIVVSHDIPSTMAISTNLWIMGHDYDEQGNVVEGSRIKEDIDLMAAGIAWNYPDVFSMPEFNDLVYKVKTAFKTL